MKRKTTYWILLILFATSIGFSGCCALAPAQATPKPKAVKGPCDCAPKDGQSKIGFYYPCGSKSCAVVYVEKIAPAQVVVGQDFDYLINITNVLKVKVADVKVTDIIPANFTLKNSVPQPSGKVWNLGTLAPNETKTIKITGSANSTDALTNCIKVTYNPLLCVVTQVIQPSLKLTADSTPEVILCDTILLTFNVTNNGTGCAQNVVVTSTLPAGVTTVDGKTSIIKRIDCLDTAQSKKYDVTLKASKPGKYTFPVVAKADGNLKANASTVTVVRQPVLTISKTGSKTVYIGRPAKYTITVKNVGDGDAVNTVVKDVLPSNMSFVSASGNGKLVGNSVQWTLGTLKPNASATLDLKLTALSAGVARDEASAVGACCDKVVADAKTDVKGIPALLLEVIDLDDPIEVGSNVTYVITVTNQGSATATNISLKCTLENNQQYVSASGASDVNVKGQVVQTLPLPTLAPKAKATWKVTVKSLTAGDVRFSVEMKSDQLKRPVSETESTNLY